MQQSPSACLCLSELKCSIRDREKPPLPRTPEPKSPQLSAGAQPEGDMDKLGDLMQSARSLRVQVAPFSFSRLGVARLRRSFWPFTARSSLSIKKKHVMLSGVGFPGGANG